MRYGLKMDLLTVFRSTLTIFAFLASIKKSSFAVNNNVQSTGSGNQPSKYGIPSVPRPPSATQITSNERGMSAASWESPNKYRPGPPSSLSFHSNDLYRPKQQRSGVTAQPVKPTKQSAQPTQAPSSSGSGESCRIACGSVGANQRQAMYSQGFSYYGVSPKLAIILRRQIQQPKSQQMTAGYLKTTLKPFTASRDAQDISGVQPQPLYVSKNFLRLLFGW